VAVSFKTIHIGGITDEPYVYGVTYYLSRPSKGPIGESIADQEPYR